MKGRDVVTERASGLEKVPNDASDVLGIVGVDVEGDGDDEVPVESSQEMVKKMSETEDTHSPRHMAPSSQLLSPSEIR